MFNISRLSVLVLLKSGVDQNKQTSLSWIWAILKAELSFR